MQITYKYQDDSTRGKGGDVAFVSYSHYVPRIGELVCWPGCEVGMTVALVEHIHRSAFFSGESGVTMAAITVWLKK